MKSLIFRSFRNENGNGDIKPYVGDHFKITCPRGGRADFEPTWAKGISAHCMAECSKYEAVRQLRRNTVLGEVAGGKGSSSPIPWSACL